MVSISIVTATVDRCGGLRQPCVTRGWSRPRAAAIVMGKGLVSARPPELLVEELHPAAELVKQHEIDAGHRPRSLDLGPVLGPGLAHHGGQVLDRADDLGDLISAAP